MLERSKVFPASSIAFCPNLDQQAPSYDGCDCNFHGYFLAMPQTVGSAIQKVGENVWEVCASENSCQRQVEASASLHYLWLRRPADLPHTAKHRWYPSISYWCIKRIFRTCYECGHRVPYIQKMVVPGASVFVLPQCIYEEHFSRAALYQSIVQLVKKSWVPIKVLCCM